MEIGKDRKAWRAVVHGVAKSQTQPSDWTAISINTLNVNESNIPIKKQRLSGCIKSKNQQNAIYEIHFKISDN